MKFFLTLCYCLSFTLLYSQSEQIEALTNDGIALHDKGDYAGAIEKYKKVLVYDPTSDLMNYEIAFSYAQSKNYRKAIEHCNIVISGKGQSVILALILKGSCLDDLGATKEADTFYKKTLKQYPDQYLLLLNYGIRCNRLSLIPEAEKSFLRALELKPTHPGTHLSMAYLKLNQGERLKGLLSLYFFLMLENNTPRAKEAFGKLLDNLDISVSQAKKDSTKINLNISFPASRAKLSRSDLGEVSLYLLTTMSAELSTNKNQFERLSYDTEKIFSILGELQAQGEKRIEDYWWGFYIPFFYVLKTAGYAEPFAYHIATASGNPLVETWKNTNKAKMDEFAGWLKKQ